MARASIHIQDENYGHENDMPLPKWYPLYYKKGGPKSGEVLLSFSYNDDDFVYKHNQLEEVPPEMIRTVKTHQFDISMNILGLRGLQSPGLLPVKKAFIMMNLKSMIPPQLGDTLDNIRTEPKMAGADPTLNTLITFSMPLPDDLLFCPRLAVTVYDSIAMGFSQPIIGNFVIDVGNLMLSLRKEREDETEDLRKVVTQLKKICSGEALTISMRNMLTKKVEETQKEMVK